MDYVLIVMFLSFFNWQAYPLSYLRILDYLYRWVFLGLCICNLFFPPYSYFRDGKTSIDLEAHLIEEYSQCYYHCHYHYWWLLHPILIRDRRDLHEGTLCKRREISAHFGYKFVLILEVSYFSSLTRIFTVSYPQILDYFLSVSFSSWM